MEYNDTSQTILISRNAFCEYSKVTLNVRREIIAAIRNGLLPRISELAKMEYEEMGMGNVPDKIIKLTLALYKTPGVEELACEAVTGDYGMTLYEYCAYGVICAVQPGTNPCATLISNVIGMLAAGNSVIYVPHPRCVAVSRLVTDYLNEIVRETCGIDNLIMTLPESSMSIADEVMCHPDIDLVVATGGRHMLSRVLSAPKRVIAAGPANPVVIVDDTAELSKAAHDIVEGASFDHNIMCVSEKSIVAVSSIIPQFVVELQKQGVYYVDNEPEMFQLTKAALNIDGKLNRALEGKSANEILQAAGIECNRTVRLIVVETIRQHPFVTEEILMPLVPLVRVADFEQALETALFIEQGFRHTAMIHSQSVERLNRAARTLQTSVFIKNGSSLAGIGLNGEEKTSFTIANMTGEGVTTARNFARRRSCTSTSGFSIR